MALVKSKKGRLLEESFLNNKKGSNRINKARFSLKIRENLERQQKIEQLKNLIIKNVESKAKKGMLSPSLQTAIGHKIVDIMLLIRENELVEISNFKTKNGGKIEANSERRRKIYIQYDKWIEAALRDWEQRGLLSKGFYDKCFKEYERRIGIP